MLHIPSLQDGEDLPQLFAVLRNSLRVEVSFVMQNADFHGTLTTTVDLPPDSVHEHRAAADDCAAISFVVEGQIERPPVVKQRDEVGEESAGGRFARGTAAPAPLILKFDKAIFNVVAVAILLRHDDNRECGRIYRGDKTPIFPLQGWLGCLIRLLGHEVGVAGGLCHNGTCQLC